MLLLMQLSLLYIYMIVLNMHAPLVNITILRYDTLQMGIEGRRRTAMRLPNNNNKIHYMKLYE